MSLELRSAWPVFETYEEAQYVDSAPAYTDSLIAVAIVLVAIGVLLYHQLIRPRGRGRALLLLTAPPRAISRVGEMLPSVGFFVVGLLESLLLVSLLVTLLLPESSGIASLSLSGFWLSVGWVALWVALLFIIATVVQAWMVYTFCHPEQISLWWADYLILLIVAANTLLIPLLLRLFTPMSVSALITVSGVLYVVYRILLCYREIRIFSHLSHYPLHIILYLCACEIGPLLYLLKVASLSVNQ